MSMPSTKLTIPKKNIFSASFRYPFYLSRYSEYAMTYVTASNKQGYIVGPIRVQIMISASILSLLHLIATFFAIIL